ncbi:MAG: hypothetical protein KBC35_02390 [Candidatus Pacebacteria bacterium]|jgi:hypothetical protein|nr:hypothetical protein [Candidatus Paceibacterota bacterium]
MNESGRNKEEDMTQVFESTFDEIERFAKTTEKQVEQTVAPIRKSVAQRFPTLFLFLITFGFTAMVTGIEHSLIKYQILSGNPEVILLIGVGILVLTGTLYKKLG